VLEDGRQDFREAVDGISAEEGLVKAGPRRWSVVECIEHVVAVEERCRGWISNGSEVKPRRDSRREMRLFTTIRSRLTKVETPEVLRPSGRFRTLAAAMAAFESSRDRTVEWARERGDLYSIGGTHPYFGKVNGAEMIQLIDGHTRRHADQIREVREAIPENSERSQRHEWKREAPGLPAEFEIATDFESLSLQELHLTDIQKPNLRGAALTIEGCLLERVQLAGGELGSMVWRDVRLTGCDLANLRAHRMTLVRVELIDCRMTGFSANALNWQHVLIRNGDVRYAQCQGGKFRNCEFDDCGWQEADLQRADLSGCIFRSCNLDAADFRGAKLENTDLRQSKVESLVVGAGDLRGAIVDPAQAMVLARVMGLQIR